MGFLNSTPSGKWRANWRDPEGKQPAKTFRTKREANTYLAQIETQKAQGLLRFPARRACAVRQARAALDGHVEHRRRRSAS